MDSWHSYSKIYAVGNRAAASVFDGPVTIEEKVDGSQFSFGVDLDGNTRVRSKNREFDVYAPDDMFSQACATVRALAEAFALVPGYTYRCEYLRKPKHNCLSYDRIPRDHLIIYDVGIGDNEYMSYAQKRAEAERLGLECVPLLFEGHVNNRDDLVRLLGTTSILGGEKIEGFVIKNYARFCQTSGKVLMAKYVSEGFKERHRLSFRTDNPTPGDIRDAIVASLKTDARFEKAFQHLRDDGKLEFEPRDIPQLIQHVKDDIMAEEAADIRDQLFKWAIGHVLRQSTRGLAEWYKGKLLTMQFEENGEY